MRLRNKLLTVIAVATSLNALADTQTVGANVAFVNDVTATVNAPIDFATLVKADGDCDMTDAAVLSGTGCPTGELSGTPAVGQVTVDGATSQNITLSVDTTNASDTGVVFTPILANSAAPTTPLLPLSGVADNLGAGGTQDYILYGSLAITAATVVDNPSMSVDFTVVY